MAQVRAGPELSELWNSANQAWSDLALFDVAALNFKIARMARVRVPLRRKSSTAKHRVEGENQTPSQAASRSEQYILAQPF